MNVYLGDESFNDLLYSLGPSDRFTYKGPGIGAKDDVIRLYTSGGMVVEFRRGAKPKPGFTEYDTVFPGHNE